MITLIQLAADVGTECILRWSFAFWEANMRNVITDSPVCYITEGAD